MDDSLYNITPIQTNLSTTTTIDTAQAVAMGIGILIAAAIITLLMYAIVAIFLGKLFKKAGIPAWQAWVPVLNNWKLFEIGGKPGFWAVLAVVPVLNIVSAIFGIIAMHNINLKLRYDAGMTVLAVLVPLVWFIIVGTSSHTWDDSLGAPRLDQPITPTEPTDAAPTAPELAPSDASSLDSTDSADSTPAEPQPPIMPDESSQTPESTDEQPPESQG